MQPDPAIFLSAASRTLIEMIDAGDIQGETGLLRARRLLAALSQLAFRVEGVPAITATLADRQQALIRKAARAIADHGLATEPLGPPPAPTLDPVQQHIDGSWMLATQLRALAGAKPVDTAVWQIFAEARALEADFRHAYEAGLAQAQETREAAIHAAARAALPPPAPEAVALCLDAAQPGSTARVSNVRKLVGINTKDIFFFDVDSCGAWPPAMVMRRLRGFSANKNASMGYEFALLSGLQAQGLPVPRPLAFSGDSEMLGAPFIIMERLPGRAALPGTGPHDFGAAAPHVGRQIAHHLAAIHRTDPASFARPEERAMPPRDLVRSYVDDYYRLWTSTQIEPSATIENGFAWVRANIENLDEQRGLVHGDFDFRNILMENNRVTAILDWERSRLGHPAQDLAYVRADIEQIMPWADFVAEYRRAGGVEVSESALRFFDIWAYTFKGASANIGTAFYKLGLHADFLLSSVGFVEGNAWTDRLRLLLDNTPGT